jgi:tetratricopeptide (TPR) repeat protein
MKGINLLLEWPIRRDQLLDNPAEAFKWIKQSNRIGEYLLAIEIAESLLEKKKGQIEDKTELAVKQQLALAFNRSGSADKAKTLLDELRTSGAADSETLGLLGSVYKILSGKAANAEEKTTLLKTSRDFYRLGFQNTSATTYCGINAATLSVMLDDPETAKSLAESTLAAVPKNEEYWDLATAAEANLLLGRFEEARELYTHAGRVAGEAWADIASTRKQCRQLCFKMRGRPDLLDDCFPSGAVGFFAGHMVDAPNRPVPRFPATAIPDVEERIRNWVTSNAIRSAVCSAACGGDILFLEIAQSLEVETHILLPFARDYFVRTSVLTGGEEWVKRFEAVTEKAKSVTVLNDDMPDYHPSSYDFTNQMISARAATRAAAYDSPLLGLALWNGQIGDAVGGTASAVVYWAKGNVPISIIHPTDRKLDGSYDEGQPPVERPFPRIYTADPLGIQTAVASMLLLRITGYQSMREKDFGLFFQHLLGALSQTMAKNDWFPARYGFGGQYLFVWESVLDAGKAAIEFMSQLQARRSQCPAKIDFSLCLHSAPVQIMVNPILNQYTHEGAAVSKLESLSEQLPPGIIYATETFASLAAFEKTRDFECKNFGTIGASWQSSGSQIYQVTK